MARPEHTVRHLGCLPTSQTYGHNAVLSTKNRKYHRECDVYSRRPSLLFCKSASGGPKVDTVTVLRAFDCRSHRLLIESDIPIDGKSKLLKRYSVQRVHRNRAVSECFCDDAGASIELFTE